MRSRASRVENNIFEIISIGPFRNRKRKLKLTDSKSHLIDYTQIPRHCVHNLHAHFRRKHRIFAVCRFARNINRFHAVAVD